MIFLFLEPEVPSCSEEDTMVLEEVDNISEDLLLDGSNKDDESDKDEIIRRLKLKVSSLQRKVRKLKFSLEETTRALNVFLNPDQIQALGKKSTRGHKWSNATCKSALQVRFSCGVKGYNNLMKLGYPLPSDRTLTRRLEDFKFHPGIQTEVFEFLKLKVALLNDTERFCVLLLDEMVIEQKVELDMGSKTMYGYCTLPPTGVVATHALVFMLAGVSTRWKQTVAYHFTGNSFPSLAAKDVILKLIQMSFDVGLTVVCVTSDMGSCNRAVWKEFGITCGKYSRTINSIPHPCNPSEKIFFMADICHLLKNIRNHLLDDKFLVLPDDVVQENGFCDGRVFLEPVKKLIQLQEDKDLKLVPKLTEKHIFVKQYQKMRVRTACELMSRDVAAGIRFGVKNLNWNPGYLATAWFFDYIDQWFSLMCSRNPVMALSKNNIDVYDSAIQKLKNFDILFEKIKVGDGKWKPVQTGVKLTTASLLDLQDVLLNRKSFGYILTSRFCQDSLENLFSTVRVKNPIPSPVAFKIALKNISIGQFMIVPPRSNCEADEGNLLADFFDVVGYRVGSDDIQDEIEIPEFELSEVEKNSLFYLCGFVARQILKTLKCDHCKGVLCGDGSDIPESVKNLLHLKEQHEGSLVLSSKWCWDLASEAEKVFQVKKDILMKQGVNVVNDMCCAVGSVGSKVPDCHDIRFLFLKKFFTLRIHFFSKSVTDRIHKADQSMGHGSRSVHMRKIF